LMQAAWLPGLAAEDSMHSSLALAERLCSSQSIAHCCLP
jgi:hypothetical protein